MTHPPTTISSRPSRQENNQDMTHPPTTISSTFSELPPAQTNTCFLLPRLPFPSSPSKLTRSTSCMVTATSPEEIEMAPPSPCPSAPPSPPGRTPLEVRGARRAARMAWRRGNGTDADKHLSCCFACISRGGYGGTVLVDVGGSSR